MKRLKKLWEWLPEVQRRFRVAQEELRDGKTESLTVFAKRHHLA